MARLVRAAGAGPGPAGADPHPGPVAEDQARHQARVEKILEDALLKISVVISDLFGASGRRFLDALVAGSAAPRRWPRSAMPRLKATRRELEDALTGRFRDIHAFEIKTHLRLIDAINEEIAVLDEKIGQQLAKVPGPPRPVSPAGWPAAAMSPAALMRALPSWGWPGGWMRSPGSGSATPGSSSPSSAPARRYSPPPGTPPLGPPDLALQAVRGDRQARPHRQGQPVPPRRGRPGRDGRPSTDTRLGARYRCIARKRGKQKAIVAVSRVICEIAWILICDPGARYEELGRDYDSSRSPARQTRTRSALNPAGHPRSPG